MWKSGEPRKDIQELATCVILAKNVACSVLFMLLK